MKKLKVCKNCGLLHKIDTQICRGCEKNVFDGKYKGFIFINNAEESQIAKKLEIKKDGIYAIKH